MKTSSKAPELSIIIPTYNEEEYCSRLVSQLNNIKVSKEIIVVDGGSTDKTIDFLSNFDLRILKTSKGRGRQLANGAKESRGEFLLFLHADNFWKDPDKLDLQKLIDQKIELASFHIEFDDEHWFLRMNAFFTSFSHPYFHFGDQGLWISREVYEKSGGFQSSQDILEDQDLYKRASRFVKARKIKDKMVVSARAYKEQGVFRLQLFYYKIWLMNYFGFSRERLMKTYDSFFN